MPKLKKEEAQALVDSLCKEAYVPSIPVEVVAGKIIDNGVVEQYVLGHFLPNAYKIQMREDATLETIGHEVKHYFDYLIIKASELEEKLADHFGRNYQDFLDS
jgi:hypothetical protein